MMKRLILTFFFPILAFSVLFSQAGELKVGMKVPEWIFPDANKKEFTMNSWPGKVLHINYIDPDESDLNDEFNNAVDKAINIDKRIDIENYKGFGIVDTKSTWKPNSLIRAIAGNKAKKYDTTILFDFHGKLHSDWGLPKDSYTVALVDKNRVCRYLHSGKIPATEHEKIIRLIIELTKE
jgi:predicted transcriptional regulator